MKSLLAIAYPTVLEAEETRLKVARLQQEYLLELEDIVVAHKSEDGKVKLHQAVHLTANGALEGSFLGLLVGLLFLNPLLGAAIGAASGAVAGALADIGINDEMMKSMGAELEPGGAILFVLSKNMNIERVSAALQGSGGKIIKTSLKHQDSSLLQEALNQSK
jgi:uncharacterized membrane protein